MYCLSVLFNELYYKIFFYDCYLCHDGGYGVGGGSGRGGGLG